MTVLAHARCGAWGHSPRTRRLGLLPVPPSSSSSGGTISGERGPGGGTVAQLVPAPRPGSSGSRACLEGAGILFPPEDTGGRSAPTLHCLQAVTQRTRLWKLPGGHPLPLLLDNPPARLRPTPGGWDAPLTRPLQPPHGRRLRSGQMPADLGTI